MEKVKKQVQVVTKTTRTVVSNAEELVIALALLVSVAYNYYDLSIRPVGSVEYSVRLASVVIAGLASFYLLVKHFNKER